MGLFDNDASVNEKGWFDDLFRVVDRGIGIFERVGIIDTPVPITPPTKPSQPLVPTVDPNIGIRDFAFRPNFSLMLIGGLLLVVVLVIGKK